MNHTLASAWISACSRIPTAIRLALPIVAATLVAALPSTVSSDQDVLTRPIAMNTPAVSGVPAAVARYADFGLEVPTRDARHIADWAVDSSDHMGTGFIIVDKKSAKVYVLDSEGRLQGTSPVLLGSARGDDAVPGIGTRPIELVRPEERTTHAGRFVGERGRNAQGEDVVWVDYDAAVSMHRVRNTNARDRRLDRLATATIDDNRISYGCINVPVAFYEYYIRPVFATHKAVIYVLPDVKSTPQVFGSYDVAALHGRERHPLEDAPD